MDLPRADFSPDRRYRYTLRRVTGLGFSTCLFICLNPSTADETVDDPTVRRCIGFSRRWAFGNLVVCNLFAYRATSPKDMKTQDDPIGPANDDAMVREASFANRVVCAWGNDGAYRARWLHVLALLHDRQLELHHLGLTGTGQPKHPLYLKSNTEPIRWG